MRGNGGSTPTTEIRFSRLMDEKAPRDAVTLRHVSIKLYRRIHIFLETIAKTIILCRIR